MATGSWSEHEQGWAAVLATLRAEGWVVDLTSSAAPVQLDGVMPSGESFYFRARNQVVLLAVGGEDPSDLALWESEEPWGKGEFDASYLPGDAGLVAIRTLHAEYLVR